MRLLFGIFILFLVLSSCGYNVFNELGSKNSDDALIFEAKQAVNVLQYDSAVTIITTRVSSSGQQKLSAREVLASAYAGKCGLNFVEYVDGLANAVSGSTFVLMANPFVGKVVDPPSCLLGLQTMDLIGTNAQRTATQNAFTAVLGMVLMGSATRLYTDNNPVNGDGAQDAAGISCGLADAQMDNVILGYAYMAQNFSSISASIGGSSETTINDSITICQGLAGAACTNTNPASITAGTRDAMKDLMNTVQYGVGTADGSNPILIPIACP